MPERPDPQSNLIQFKRPKREGNLKAVHKTYDSCRHNKCFVDEGKRLVTCQACGVFLDPFQVLYEMALKERKWLNELDEWDARRESVLSQRYDEQWEEERGWIKSPPEDAATLRIWETFRAYFNGTFVAMFKRKQRLRSGPEWFGKSTYGACVSLEFANSQLIPKAIANNAKGKSNVE